MTRLTEIIEQIETAPARDPAEVLAEVLADEEGVDYRLPPLTSGARAYLARYDGDHSRMILEAWVVAAEYGSLKTHRLHAVMAAQRLGLYERRNGKGDDA